jgi:two-component sensor histidine kinase
VAIKQDASGEIFAIHWCERGGPAPQDRDAGFGTVMPDASAVQLGLKITRDWGPEGLEVTFTATAQENE